jgi:PAS domain S-box-containing protein
MEFDQSHMISLFENATEGFIVTNSKGGIMLVNPSACRMFGYTAEELVGQPVEVLIPHRYRAGHVQLRDGFYENPHTRVMGHGRDLYGERKDGATFPVEVSLSTYTQQGERFVIAFVVDITHRKLIEQSVVQHQKQLEQVTDDMRKLNAELEAKVEERTIILKEALQRLEESQTELSEALDKERQLNEIKSRFVAMASHEFRTPLSTVLSSASLLSKYTREEEQDKRNRHIEKIKGSVKHLNDLLEDFLSLGRLDEGKVGVQFLSFNLEELVQDTVEEMRGLAKGDQRVSSSHEGAPEVVSDRKLVKNVLINLISNAIKFSGEGQEVMVRCQVGEEKALISVSDQGIGIPEEDQEHLFTSFFRGRNVINIQGTGLGLHIVKRYVDLLGGTVQLRSTLGKGTTITFSIPVKANEHGEYHPGH